MVSDSNNKTNFLHKLLLTNTQISVLRKAFANGSSSNINFSKAYLSKIIQLGEFLGHLRPLDNIIRPELGLALEVMESLNSAKGKNDPKALSEGGSNFIDNKTNIKPSSLLRVSGITLTNFEIKDIAKVIRLYENRGILLKKQLKILLVKKRIS